MPKNHRARTRKHGGRVLGVGSFGCGFAPPLKCLDEPARRSNQYITKVFKYKKHADEEYAASQIITPIDPTRQYFLTAYHKCQVNTANIDPLRNKPANCPHFKPNSQMVVYDNGGIDLIDITLNGAQVGPFFRGFENLFKGLVVLHNNNLVHLDIKPENVVAKLLPDERILLRYIDFSFVSRSDLLTGNSPLVKNRVDHFLNKMYPIYPIDFFKIDSQYANVTVEQQYIKNWYEMLERNNLIDYLPMAANFDEDFYQKFSADNLNQYLQYNSVFYKNTNEMLKAVDVYSLGVTLSILYFRFTRHTLSIDASNNRSVVIFNEITGEAYPVDSPLAAQLLGYNPEMIAFHKGLASFSFKFYQIIESMLQLSPERIIAQQAVDAFSIIMGDLAAIFANPAIVEKSLKKVGVKLNPLPPVAPLAQVASLPPPPVAPLPPPSIALAPPVNLTGINTLLAAADTIKAPPKITRFPINKMTNSNNNSPLPNAFGSLAGSKTRRQRQRQRRQRSRSNK